ncbi:putative bifunctional diguanylate cyclase/phosphodiesterase [Marinobacterium rhizophilum]|uniref:EAL domain-containing protein n=1 Tax=Marinobacterium rhizophilum TaxID=420402 RepID=A0ABY5HF17_9GAMM|nr:EAL domain-containing protein [Marinobacterium rhizophilum]UTW10559.1 EAL domain-containing protein [Marinobacterium rhizophilum]
MTYWLTVISITLLLVFSGVLYLQFHHSRLLSGTVQYSESNVSWNIFQLQSEALRFNNAISTAALEPAIDMDTLRLRYDIFYSRVDTVRSNPATHELLKDTGYKSVLQRVDDFLLTNDPYFIQGDHPPLDPASMQSILHQLDNLQTSLNDLSLASVHQSGLHAERRATEIQRQIAISTGLIVFQLLLTLLFFFIVIRQIKQLQASRAQLSNLANFDPLTNLPNRRLFQDRLEQEIRKAHRSKDRLALLFLDLDNFKDINDTLGHEVGDLLLQEAARRLAGCVRESDTVARLGGDEFTIVLNDLEGTEHAAGVSQAILKALSDPFELKGREGFVSASIGITFYPDDAADVNTLLKNADQAMYVAKEQGRNRFHYFTASMQEMAQAKMHLTNDLRNALAQNEFQLVYQPIIEFSSGRVQKAEALIRWNHPVRGAISPMEFIPVAEETGLIVDIGNWVFHEAARQTQQWRQRYQPDFQLSINTSPLQLRADASSLQHWQRSLKSVGLPGSALAIEITESLLMDAGFAERLIAMHELGIEVSLDDFGTGYSSMSYLKKFDIDYLKIDKSFVGNLQKGSSDFAICEAVIVMAHKLGIMVIAEGIETSSQLSILDTMGCDYGQGYLFSHPVSALELEKLFKADLKSLSVPNLG